MIKNSELPTMNEKKRIIFFDRSNMYGGHEIMSCKTIEYLAGTDRYSIIAIISFENNRLMEKLSKLKIKIISIPGHSNRFQSIGNYLDIKLRHRLEKLLQSTKPDLIIALQGNIEYSSEILMPARKLGIKIISYIPLADCFGTVSNHKFMGIIRDRIDQRLFQIPSKWITVNSMQKELICSRGKRNAHDVIVIKNGIDFQKLDNGKEGYDRLRQRLEIEEKQTIFGMIGRVELRHKGQDLIIRTLAAYRKDFQNCVFVFAGDGRDRMSLENLALELRVQNQVRFLGNVTDVASFYTLCDVIVIPSWFEGDPLVMYEALYSGCIVCGNKLPCFKGMIPDKYIFDNNDYNSIKAALLEAKGDIGTVICGKENLRSDRSMEKFQKKFCKVIDHILEE